MLVAFRSPGSAATRCGRADTACPGVAADEPGDGAPRSELPEIDLWSSRSGGFARPGQHLVAVGDHPLPAVLDRQRHPDPETLAELAAEPDQVLPGAPVGHPLGHHRQPEVVPEVDDRADDRRVEALAVARGQERAVDLQLVHRQAAQVGQRGVAGAEVVDRQPHPAVAQLPQHQQRPVRVGHDAGLGDLQGEQVGRQPVQLQQPVDQADQGVVDQAAQRDVGRDADAGQLVLPGRAGGHRDPQHVLGQHPDQPAALGQRDELGRRHHAVLGVGPAGQRLGPGQRAVVQVDLRLQVHLDLAGVDRLPQVGDQGQPGARGGVGGRVEDAQAAAELLGLVHRQVGPLEQGRGVVAVLGGQRDTDRGADRQLQAVHPERLLERVHQDPAELDGVVGGAAALHHRELVAAQARDQHPGVLTGRLQPLPDLLQQQVALLVAEGVVDVLEPVQVEDGHRQRLRRRLAQPAGQVAHQHGAVRQVGERVVQRVEAQLVDQPSVAQRGRGVVGDHLQQLDVVRREAAHVALSVVDHQHRDRLVLAGQRHHQPVAQAALVQVAALVRVERLPGQQHRAAVPDQRLGDPGLPGRVGLRRPADHDVALQHHLAPGLAGTVAREGEPGRLGVQQPAGLQQQGPDHLVGAVRVGDGPAELVEPGQRLVLLAQAGVLAPGDQQQRAAGQHRDRRPAAAEPGGRDDDAEDGGGQGLQGRAQAEPQQVQPARGGLDQLDHQTDADRGQPGGQRGRPDGQQPADRDRAGQLRGQQVHHGQRDGRLGAGQGQVEGELLGPLELLADHPERQQGADDPGRDQGPGRDEEQPDHHRDLAQEDRAGLPAQLDVQHERLAGGEGQGQRQPFDPRVARQLQGSRRGGGTEDGGAEQGDGGQAGGQRRHGEPFGPGAQRRAAGPA